MTRQELISAYELQTKLDQTLRPRLAELTALHDSPAGWTLLACRAGYSGATLRLDSAAKQRLLCEMILKLKAEIRAAERLIESL